LQQAASVGFLPSSTFSPSYGLISGSSKSSSASSSMSLSVMKVELL